MVSNKLCKEPMKCVCGGEEGGFESVTFFASHIIPLIGATQREEGDFFPSGEDSKGSTSHRHLTSLAVYASPVT